MDGLKNNYLQLISPEKARFLIFFVVIAFLFDFAFFSLPVMAAESDFLDKHIIDPVNLELFLESPDRYEGHILESGKDRHAIVSAGDPLITETIGASEEERLRKPPVRKLSNEIVVNKIIEMEKAAAAHLPGNLNATAKAVKKPINYSYKSVKGKKLVTMTAYNSEKAQTDNSPCTTANGFNVCKHGIEDTVAANFLPFGTKVKIPALFGERVFIVRDRMNARYTSRVDVWMKNKSDALKFGVRHAEVVIVE